MCSHQGSTSSVLVSGIQFQSGPLGSREVCFTYKSYVERVLIKVTAGVPTQLKLISEPDKVRQDFLLKKRRILMLWACAALVQVKVVSDFFPHYAVYVHAGFLVSVFLPLQPYKPFFLSTSLCRC